MQKKRIKILSTLNTNIGDEFIRDGVTSVIKTLTDENHCEFTLYNKHQPWTFFHKHHPARLAGLIDEKFHRGWHKGLNLLSALSGNEFFEADLIIQSGTPVIWTGASHSEWATPFWRNMVFKNSNHIPVLNIGGGSCYAWSNPPERLEGQDRDFAQKMVQHCSLTTCREPLAALLLSEASGQTIEVIECPGFLAGQSHVKTKGPDNRILFNVMRIGGHFDFQNEINPNEWLKTMNQTIKYFNDNHQIELICHDINEFEFARHHWPELPAHLPANPKQYFELCNGAAAAVVNRLHAAVGMSGLGIPCIAIGTDTRMLMTKQIGIETLFAPEVTTQNLIPKIQSLLKDRDKTAGELLKKRDSVLEKYQNLMKPFI